MPHPQSPPNDCALADWQALEEVITNAERLHRQYLEAVLLVQHAAGRYVRNELRRLHQKPRQGSSKLAYRISEVAKLTGISEASVARAIERGELRAVKLNSTTDTSARLILAGDLERWLLSLPER
ncbi:MAG: helix-turn-helix domain-containing protein [Sphingomonadaceae bacterium]